jgi:DNA-binding NarL/FixJ family response regulator
MEKRIKVCLVEDNKEYVENFDILVKEHDEIHLIAYYKSVESLLEHIDELDITTLLLDIELPGMSGIEAAGMIKKLRPDIDIIMLTVHEDNQSVFEALKNGAVGYITKVSGFEQVVDAIKEVDAGGAPMSGNIAKMVINSFHQKENDILTNREMEVLKYLEQGRMYKEIADIMFVHLETVKSHIKNIYQKLNATNKTEAVIKAKNQRLI